MSIHGRRTGVGAPFIVDQPDRGSHIAAAGPIFWWIVNSLAIGEQSLLNQRSLPAQASMPRQ